MPWCKYFIPKIAASGIGPDDPNLNDHIMYAKCIKGHVLRNDADWIQCENLPASDATCWQEGGDTLFTLAARRRKEEEDKTSARNSNKRQPAKLRR